MPGMAKNWILIAALFVLPLQQAEAGPCTEAVRLVSELVRLVKQSDAQSRAERLKDAADQLADLNRPYEVFQHIDDITKIVSRTENGKKNYYVETKSEMGRLHREPLLVDPRTGFFAIQGKGSELLEYVIQTGAGSEHERKSDKTIVSIIDINHLGIVNYFKEGQSAGDMYLAHVARVIHKQIRKDDNLSFFLNLRTGGDELTIVSRGLSELEITRLLTRLNKAIVDDPEIQKIFNQERQLRPEATELQNIYGSVSIGSTVVRQGDSFENAQTRASKQIAEVKMAYKQALGLDTSKYGKNSHLPEVSLSSDGKTIYPPVQMPN